MTREAPASAQQRPLDPWAAVSYLVTGVGFWGGMGWLLDRWLGTTLFIVLGLLLGAGCGIYLVYIRLGKP